MSSEICGPRTRSENTSPSPVPSRRNGVAVTPSRDADGARASTLTYVDATVWCASSITMCRTGSRSIVDLRAIV